MAATVTLKEPSRTQPEPFKHLNEPLWHPSVAQRISRHGRPDQPGKGWDAWAATLARRKKPAGLAELLPGRTWPLAWSLPDELAESSTADFLARLAPPGKKNRRPESSLAEELEMWLAEAAGAPAGPAHGLECLALAHAAPRLSGLVSPRLWWELLDHLIDVARGAGATDLSTDPLGTQLATGELPLSLAYLFPEILPCRDLWAAARENLSAAPVELLDGEGMPQGKHLHLLRPLLALWTRAQAIAEAQRAPCFSDKADAQYTWLVRCALMLSRHDGSQLLSHGSAGAWQSELFEHAIDFGGDEDDEKAARLTLPGQKPGRGKRVRPESLPAPAINSEWSGVAVLRPDWSKGSPRLAVNYQGRQFQLELDCGRGMLLSGQWDHEVRIDGRRLEPHSDWDELCWVSDDEVDYLELEIDLESGVRLGRQMLFARDDRFLFLADVILANSSAQIDYLGSLPLAAGAGFDPAKETREGVLTRGKKLGLVMPLALPEWRVDPRYGSLSVQGSALELQQSGSGRGLYCPMFIDLDPRRTTGQFTWRQLTVGMERTVQPRDVAVGYRVQCGRRQWLFYRSLAKPANRTVLGHNLVSDFLAGQFDRQGTVEPLIEIE